MESKTKKVEKYEKKQKTKKKIYIKNKNKKQKNKKKKSKNQKSLCDGKQGTETAAGVFHAAPTSPWKSVVSRCDVSSARTRRAERLECLRAIFFVLLRLLGGACGVACCCDLTRFAAAALVVDGAVGSDDEDEADESDDDADDTDASDDCERVVAVAVVARAECCS